MIRNREISNQSEPFEPCALSISWLVRRSLLALATAILPVAILPKRDFVPRLAAKGRAQLANRSPIQERETKIPLFTSGLLALPVSRKKAFSSTTAVTA